MTVDELLIKVTLNAKELNSSLSKAEKSINQFAHNITSTINVALDAIALKFSFSFGKNLIESFSNTGAKLGYLAQQIGDNAGKLDQWATASRKAGGSADSFYNTVNNLRNKLVDMKVAGDPKTASIFGMLGISTTNAKNELKKPTDILLELSGKLKGQSKDFQQYLGRQLGIDDATLRILSKGREETLKLVNAQNLLWDDKSIAEAQQMQNKLIDADQAFDKLKITIAEKLLPYAVKFIDWIQSFVDKHGKDLANTIEQVVAALVSFAQYIPQLIEYMVNLNKELGISGKDLAKIAVALLGLKIAKDIFGFLTNGATAATTAINALLTPLGAMVSAIMAIKWVFNKYEEFKKDPESFNTGDRSLTNVKGKIGRLFEGGEKLGSAIYDMLNPTVDINATKIAPKDYDKYIARHAPAIAQIESSGGVNIDSGNGAYGAYQVRPNWGNRARAQEGLPAQTPEWYKQPENSYATYQLMMRQNLTTTKGDVDKAFKMYSGGNYGLDKVLATKVNPLNPMLLGANNPQNPNLASNQATQAMMPKSALTQANNQTQTINIQNMNVKADDVDDLLDSVQSRINPAMQFNNSPRLT